MQCEDKYLDRITLFISMKMRGRGVLSKPSSFPRRRESRDMSTESLDARLRGHDSRNSPTPQLVNKKSRSVLRLDKSGDQINSFLSLINIE